MIDKTERKCAPGKQISKPANLVQAIERASLLLDVLGESPQGISVKDLSARVGLPKGTTHRFLSSLAYFGYVRQDQESKNYHLGFRLVELGYRLLNQLDLRNEARPLLSDLAQRTEETVHLVVMDQNEVVYVDKVECDESPGALRMASRIGLRNPAHSSAVGKIFLAHLPENKIDEFIELKGLVRRTPNTITEPAALKDQLKTIRVQGFAVDNEENEKGIRCVAAPIRNAVGRIVAAISISGPTVRITMRRIDEDLRFEVMETGLKISIKMGYRERP